MFKKNTIELKNWNNCTSGELESRREAYLSNTVCIEVMESLASLKTSAKAAGLLKKKSYCRHNQSKIHNQDDDCEATCMHSWAVYWNWKMTISERSLSGTGFRRRNPSDYSKLRSIANAAHTWKGLKFGCQFLLRILQLDWYLQYLVFLMYPWEELHLPKIFHAIFQSSSHLTRLENHSLRYIS